MRIKPLRGRKSPVRAVPVPSCHGEFGGRRARADPHWRTMTDEPDDWYYASAKTLPGALQRGSGAAGAWVANHAVAPELVWDCVRRDYRWDRQVDERTTYLARLVLDAGLPVDPVVERLWRAGRTTGYDGNAFGQCADVLAALARTPVPAAMDALRQYVCEGE